MSLDVDEMSPGTGEREKGRRGPRNARHRRGLNQERAYTVKEPTNAILLRLSTLFGRKAAAAGTLWD